MMKILLIGPERTSFSAFDSALIDNNTVELTWIGSGAAGLNKISQTGFDLVVADEKLGDMTGLDFAGKLVALNPMINCAVVSSLPNEEFHEASEGLGLLAQLPANPEKEDVETLLGRLENITAALSRQI